MSSGWWVLIPAGLALASGLSGTRSDEDPTYSETIRPILQRSCIPCHQPNGEAPFSLATYAEVKKRAALLRWVCIVGTMPPTDAHSELTTLLAVPQLTDADIVNIQEWVRTGAKEGKRMPPTIAGDLPWRNSQPRHMLKPKRAGTIPAEGPPHRKLIVLDADNLVGQAITRFSLLAESPLPLRHAYLAVVPKDIEPDEVFTALGIKVKYLVGAWAPGSLSWRSPSGVVLRKGDRLAIWALFQPTGKPESAGFELQLDTDSSSVQPEWVTLGNRDFSIKPNDGRETLRAEWTLPLPHKLVAIVPECKLYAQQVRITAEFPEGKGTKTILAIQTWDPNWVGAYNPKDPIILPRGTRVVVEIDYDNSGHSAGNRGEKPTTSIKFGPTDTDEHFWVHLQTVPHVP